MAKARAPAAAAPLFEYPWYAIAITLLAAAAVTVLIVRSAGDHAAAVIESARAAESARLRQNVSRGDANATAAIQIEDVAARLFSPVRDRYEVQRDLLRLLRASNAGLVSGVGVFYAPRAFDANHRLNGFYVDRGMLARGATYWLNDGFGFDYPSAPWYRAAVEARGRLVVTRPYFAHGHTFISVVREFFDGANPVGVVIVDALRATIVRNMRVTLARGEVAYITDLGGFVTVASGRIPSGGAFEEQSMAFRSIPWTMHLVADFAGVHAAQRRIWVAAAVEIALVWCLTAAILFGLARLARYKAQTQLLAEHSDALENEIAVRAAVEERLRVTAYRDLLTGLPNRAHILETLQSAIGRGGAPGSFGVFFIDLDQFAVINDSLGHSTGDALLKHIAERIAGNLPPAAVLGRLGGDEFIVYAPLAEPEDAHALARNLLQTLRRPFAIGGRRVYTGASVGVVLSGPRYEHPEELLRDADIAMYRAKEAGRGRFVVFDEDMHERALQRMLVESALRSAIHHSEFCVRYQPIVNVATGEVCAVEALCRWSRPEHGEVGPVEFIPIAEQTGAIAEIDSFVLRQACSDARALTRRFPHVPVSVNVSATRLTHGDFVPGISRALFESSLDARCIKLEITETAIMGRPEEAVQTLARLREIGVAVEIDDFGAGYSSLSYIQRLPISGLKIDRSFVKPMVADPQSAAIVRAIVGLAKTLGLRVTAEGVETPQQLQMLAEMGVDFAQGFYFSPAVAFDALESLIAARVLRIPG